MNTNDFDYYLPEELIAQTPLKDRSSSRLLVLDRKTGEITHRHFKDIIDYLDNNDVLVLNDTKVIPARLFGVEEDTEAHIEVLMLKDMGNDVWQCLCKPARRVKVGTVVSFGEGLLKAICQSEDEDGIRYFKMVYEGIFLEILDKLGTMPLPPYIHEHLEDKDRYQTVYAKNPGSAAALPGTRPSVSLPAAAHPQKAYRPAFADLCEVRIFHTVWKPAAFEPPCGQGDTLLYAALTGYFPTRLVFGPA